MAADRRLRARARIATNQNKSRAGRNAAVAAAYFAVIRKADHQPARSPSAAILGAHYDFLRTPVDTPTRDDAAS